MSAIPYLTNNSFFRLFMAFLNPTALSPISSLSKLPSPPSFKLVISFRWKKQEFLSPNQPLLPFSTHKIPTKITHPNTMRAVVTVEVAVVVGAVDLLLCKLMAISTAIPHSGVPQLQRRRRPLSALTVHRPSPVPTAPIHRFLARPRCCLIILLTFMVLSDHPLRATCYPNLPATSAINYLLAPPLASF